jgi:hypothetical protein
MTDYYHIQDSGCCLICPNSYDGCLCYNCKCRKCDAYDRGICSYVDYFKQQRADQRWEEQQRQLKQEVDRKKPETPQLNLFGKKIRKNTIEYFERINRGCKK